MIPTEEETFNLFRLHARRHAVCTIPSACKRGTDVIIAPDCQRTANFIWRPGHVQNLRKWNLRSVQSQGSLMGTRCGLGRLCLPASSPHTRCVRGSSVQGEFGFLSTCSPTSAANCRARCCLRSSYRAE
jgi:hypothetical protein